jgi:hypothetical protein
MSSFAKGERLYCPQCGSEIEILNPSTRKDPDQAFHCCGSPMLVTTEVAIHVNSEG